MLKTFFFIPAGNKHFFSALTKYKPDYFVFDLEDSVSSENLGEALEYILQNPFCSSKPIFVRLWDIRADIISENISLFSTYKNFILPKVDSSEQLDLFFNGLTEIFQISGFQFIILIESPKGIINLNAILQKHNEHIYGIGFGSHDYCSEMGAVHLSENYDFARNSLLVFGKAYGKICIDIASTNINDENLFIDECKEGFNFGFVAKPILHPWQLEQLQKICFYKEEEIMEAKTMFKQFNGFIPIDISALKINGKIIEKPHIKRINSVIEYILKQKKELS